MSEVIQTMRLKNRVQRSYDGSSLKERIQNEISNPLNHINAEILVVATTSKQITFKALVNKLDKMNYHTNYALIGEYFMRPFNHHKRVGMHCFQQKGNPIDKKGNKALRLPHSHILLNIPIGYDVDYVIDLMNKGFKRLDDRDNKLFEIYKETARDKIGNIIYASRQLKDNYKPEDYTYRFF